MTGIEDTTTSSSSSSSTGSSPGHTTRVQKNRGIPILIQSRLPSTRPPQQIPLPSTPRSTIRIQSNEYSSIDDFIDDPPSPSPPPTFAPPAGAAERTVPDVPTAVVAQTVATIPAEAEPKKKNFFRSSLDKLEKLRSRDSQDKSANKTPTSSFESKIPLPAKQKSTEKKSLEKHDSEEGESVPLRGGGRFTISTRSTAPIPAKTELVNDEPDSRRASVQTAFNLEHDHPSTSKVLTTVDERASRTKSPPEDQRILKHEKSTTKKVVTVPAIMRLVDEENECNVSVHENCTEEAEVSTKIVLDKSSNIKEAKDVEVEVRRQITTDVGPSMSAHLKAIEKSGVPSTSEEPREKRPKMIRLDLKKVNPVYIDQDSQEDVLRNFSAAPRAAIDEFRDISDPPRSPSRPASPMKPPEPKTPDVVVLKNRANDIIVLRKSEGPDKYDKVSLGSNDQLVLQNSEKEEVVVLTRSVPPEEALDTRRARTKSEEPRKSRKEHISPEKVRLLSKSPEKDVKAGPKQNYGFPKEPYTGVVDNLTVSQEMTKDPTVFEAHTRSLSKAFEVESSAPPAARSVPYPQFAERVHLSASTSPEKEMRLDGKHFYGFSAEPYTGELQTLQTSAELGRDTTFFESRTHVLGKASEVQGTPVPPTVRSVPYPQFAERVHLSASKSPEKELRLSPKRATKDSPANNYGLSTEPYAGELQPLGVDAELSKDTALFDSQTRPLSPHNEVGQAEFIPRTHSVLRFSSFDQNAALKPVEVSVRETDTELVLEKRYESPARLAYLPNQRSRSVPDDRSATPIDAPQPAPMKEASVEPGRTFKDMSIRVDNLQRDEDDSRQESAPLDTVSDSRVKPLLRPMHGIQMAEETIDLSVHETKAPTNEQAEVRVYRERFSEAPILPISDSHVLTALSSATRPVDDRPVRVEVEPFGVEKSPRPMLSPVSAAERELLRQNRPPNSSPRPRAIIEPEMPPSPRSVDHRLDEDLKFEEQRLNSLSEEVIKQAAELNNLDFDRPRQRHGSQAPNARQGSVRSNKGAPYQPETVKIAGQQHSSLVTERQRSAPLAKEEDEDDLYNDLQRDADKYEAQKREQLHRLPLHIAAPLPPRSPAAFDEAKENGYPGAREVNGIYRPGSRNDRAAVNGRPTTRPKSPMLPPAPRIGAQSPTPSYTSDFSFSPRTLSRINNFNIIMEDKTGITKDGVIRADNGDIITHHPVFMRDTSKYWYKPGISREEAINMLKDKEPGTFVVRDSNSFPGAFGLALKVAQAPAGVERADGTELVRHFLIEPSAKGVKLKGCNNEPVFGTLAALIYQHSITPLALPQRLILPEYDPAHTPEHVNANQALLERGAACNVTYICSLDTESLTGPEAVRRAANHGFELLGRRQLRAVPVHFKVSAQGITLTDNTRSTFFRRHYPVNTVTFAGIDPDGRAYDNNNTHQLPSTYVRQAPIFGFVARKTPNSLENTCHVFAELDPEQPASAVVRFITNVMMVQARAQQAVISRTTNA